MARWTKEQKHKALKLAESTTIKEASEKFGVPEGTIKRWRSEQKRNEPNQKAEPKTNQNNGVKSQAKVRKGEDEGSYELTEKQRLFAEIYVRNFNATQAAIKAGYSPDTAYSIGYENLRKPKVREYIDYLKGLKKESIMLNEDDIVERYMRIAFADMTDFVEFGQEEVPVITKDGPIKVMNPETGEEEFLKQSINVVKFNNSNQVDGGLICEIKTSRQGASIKLEDRQKALNWLANFFEMNPEHKLKKEHDKKKLQLERERFEYTKAMDKMKVF